MVDDVVTLLRQRYGEKWGSDDEANLRFSVDAELLLRDVDGAHLIGDPAVEDGQVTLTVWVDFPLEDLMTADQLAYDIFSRLSEEIFFTERRFDARSIRYPFVTGSSRHGHVGALILAGPHAADFADRHHVRTGGDRFHA
ncbi:MAG: hypothetical protein ACRDJH_16810 [Thermomicrobiales bacterium]